jgi:fructose-1-phosphate kinase PfkB-like protein
LFLTVCLNPVLQKTIVFGSLEENTVNRSSEYYFDAAGKGIHVSRVLAQLGEEVVHLTQTGGRLKPAFLQLLKEENFKLVDVNSNADIRFCCTLLNKKKRTTTEIVEQGEVVAVDIDKAIFNHFQVLLKKCDWLIISGTKAPGFSEELFPSRVKAAKAQHKRVLLDIKGEDLLNSLKYRPDFLKVNTEEFFTTFFPDTPLHSQKRRNKLLELARTKIPQLYRQLGIHTIITNQEHDIIFNHGPEIHAIEPRRIKPVNTTGCGDAFTAGFVSEYAKYEDVFRAVGKGEECARKNALLVQPGRIR